MRVICYNQQMLDRVIEDMRTQFEQHKRLNVSYEKSHKERTLAQVGFLFAALINQITDYFRDCGLILDEEDVRYHLYDRVSEFVPEMVVDKTIFGGKPRIKHLSEMDRELCSKFIDGIFQVIDQDPIYSGLQLHPSVYFNWCFHLDKEEIKQAQTEVLPERDENYLNYQRTRPCMICGIQHRSQAHHVRDTRTAGMAIKSPDWFSLPLCSMCHMTVAHGTGFKDAMSWLPLELMDFCRINYIRWRNHK